MVSVVEVDEQVCELTGLADEVLAGYRRLREQVECAGGGEGDLGLSLELVALDHVAGRLLDVVDAIHQGVGGGR